MLALLLVLAMSTSTARAQPLPMQSPFDAEVRRHYYERLARSPWRALGWELLFPGAGSVYTGVHAAAVVSLTLSLAGSCMWIAGAVRERPATMWVGIGTFAAARAHGLVSAPVSAALLNAAFRRQLGLMASF